MAAGDTLLTIMPLQNQGQGSGYATVDRRNNHWLLDFDDTTEESAIFAGILPRNYAGGGLTIYVHYAMSSATSGNVVWTAAFERIGDGQQDIDSDGFAAAQSSGAVAVPGTSGHVDICTIAFTNGAQMDSLAVGEAFRLKVTRDADNGSDTATGDAEILGIELRETG